MTNLFRESPKLLFVGVFENNFHSTNTSQLLSLKEAFGNVVGYNYRSKAAAIGHRQRDADLIRVVREHSFDLVLYSKCNQVGFDTFEEISKISRTCLWFMDPIVSYNEEMQRKTGMVDYFCCDKQNVLQAALKLNPNSFLVHEGFDSRNDSPHELQKEHDVTFIGSVYGNRQKIIDATKGSINVVSNTYGQAHAKEVSKSRINLNFCTSNGASDRVYKILAAKGFLLTDDWSGREDTFKDLKDLVVFKDTDDLNEKIDFYLNNPAIAEAIAEQGYQTVQKYTRDAWAKQIMEINEQTR